MLLLQVLKILALLCWIQTAGSLWSWHWIWVCIYPILLVLLRTNECLITEKSSLTPGSIYITNLATWVLYMWFLEGTEQEHHSKSPTADVSILHIIELSAGSLVSSGRGLTGIVKTRCRRQWTLPSSWKAQQIIFLGAVNELSIHLKVGRIC